jgi:hypothetical protein
LGATALGAAGLGGALIEAPGGAAGRGAGFACGSGDGPSPGVVRLPNIANS